MVKSNTCWKKGHKTKQTAEDFHCRGTSSNRPCWIYYCARCAAWHISYSGPSNWIKSKLAKIISSQDNSRKTFISSISNNKKVWMVELGTMTYTVVYNKNQKSVRIVG